MLTRATAEFSPRPVRDSFNAYITQQFRMLAEFVHNLVHDKADQDYWRQRFKPHISTPDTIVISSPSCFHSLLSERQKPCASRWKGIYFAKARFESKQFDRCPLTLGLPTRGWRCKKTNYSLLHCFNEPHTQR